MPIRARAKFPRKSAFRRSTRSTIAPMGTAKKSQGRSDKADRSEIRTGSRVKVIARSGAAKRRTPSAKLVINPALQMRLKSDPSPLLIRVEY